MIFYVFIVENIKHKTINMSKTKCCKGGKSIYNYEGLPAQYCPKHRLEGMVNVMDKRCAHEEGCRSPSPSFNFPGSKGGVYCKKHQKPGMVDVMDKRCAHEEGCRSPSPSFNFPGSKGGVYCKKHQKPGMVDVRHKRCTDERCTGTRPSFNFPGMKGGVYCREHQKPGMVDVVNKRCADEGCRSISPVFNFPGMKGGIYCDEHQKPGMENVKSKRCNSDLCDIFSRKKYDWYCVRCYAHLFPDKPISKNYKTKEKTVVDFAMAEFPDVDWVWNRRIQDGCSRRQPDLILDLGFQVVIIEVDENQHRNGYTCENKRVMELSLDVGHRPIVFIRFNPDGYKTSEKVVKSCWGMNNKTHTCRVNPGKKQEWNDRLDKLCETIEYWANTPTLKTIETIHLFYDE
jgi:hypothetical protein